ncbi:hypothetical protein BMS3Abin14_00587 [bacterium BMS3Abin14]|nr:hypothetical protein BMS3Abin14_00587 [bacterium BMS3Abin14]
MDLIKEKHLEMLRKVARRLGETGNMVVYVGGSVAGLFSTDPASSDIRATADVDLIADVRSRSEYWKMEEAFRELGFKHVPEIVCRWRLGDLFVDLMPPEDGIAGTSTNRWYRDAIRNSQKKDIGDGVFIRLVTPPYFVATKLEAFLNRGKDDYMASHDLEDVIAIVDAREELPEEIATADHEVRKFISELFARFLEDPKFLESLPGKLRGDAANQARLPIIVMRMEKIARL